MRQGNTFQGPIRRATRRATGRVTGPALRLAALILCAADAAWSQVPLAEFPRGVRLRPDLGGEVSGDLSADVSVLEVDWREHWLRARMLTGVTRPDTPALRWDRVEEKALIIQLAEPVEIEGRTGLALECRPASSAAARRGRTRDRWDVEDGPPASDSPDTRLISPTRDEVRIGGVLPWFFLGPAVTADPDGASPLVEGTAAVGVRWLGHPADWAESPPAFLLRDHLILSVFDPHTGMGYFALVSSRGNRPAPLSEMTQWVTEMWSPRSWIAVHAMGPHARIGRGEWMMTATGTPDSRSGMVPPRIGAALALSMPAVGDEIDWMSMERVSIRSSSPVWGEGNHGAVKSGRLWPAPLGANVWTGARSGDTVREPPWLEVRLFDPRQVRAVRLIHAEAVGFSRGFNVPAARLTLKPAGSAPAVEIALEDLRGPMTTIRLTEPISLETARLEFPPDGPTGLIRTPPRLAGLQLLGPWDGTDAPGLAPTETE